MNLADQINEKLDEINKLKTEQKELIGELNSEEYQETAELLIKYAYDDLESLIFNKEISGLFTNEIYINSSA
jgi:predicted lipid-binding transport protein (Tim44 family)